MGSCSRDPGTLGAGQLRAISRPHLLMGVSLNAHSGLASTGRSVPGGKGGASQIEGLYIQRCEGARPIPGRETSLVGGGGECGSREMGCRVTLEQ